MPNISVQVSTAMHEALTLHAKNHSAKNARVTISDVVVGVLRNAGFERDDVLKALQEGQRLDIDVRRRTAAAQRSEIERVHEYLISRGCQTVYALQRNLHMRAHEVNRAVAAAIERKLAAFKPFDRPPVVHWLASCKCTVKLPLDLR